MSKLCLLQRSHSLIALCFVSRRAILRLFTLCAARLPIVDVNFLGQSNNSAASGTLQTSLKLFFLLPS